jgi:hypothetical protein
MKPQAWSWAGLKERVPEFMKRSNDEKSFLISYYTGHAKENIQSNEALIWAGWVTSEQLKSIPGLIADY